ncbi:MAG: hypothetical protein WBC31_14625 [Candidatus Phosphoribacter baldrii]|jgi:hypothetical protein
MATEGDRWQTDGLEVRPMRSYEIRLLEHDSEPGEILVDDLERLAGAFKDIVYRLTRHAAEHVRAGRAPGDVERLSQVRLSLLQGSTRLCFRVGDQHSLDVDPLAETVDQRFQVITDGMVANQRPGDLPDSVAQAVDRLVVALTRATPRAEITTPGQIPKVLATRRLSRSPWQQHDEAGVDEVAIYGILEMVDLHSSRFRVRDVAGNAVDLLGVANAAEVAHLVGDRVRARGVLRRGTGTQHHRLEGPVVEAAPPIAARLGVAPLASLDQLLEAARRAPAPPPIEISDAEMDEFLAAVSQ